MLRSAGLLRISPRAGVRGSLCSHHVFVIVLLRTEIRENCSHSAGQSLASKPLRVSNKDQIISLRRNGKKTVAGCQQGGKIEVSFLGNLGD